MIIAVVSILTFGALVLGHLAAYAILRRQELAFRQAERLEDRQFLLYIHQNTASAPQPPEAQQPFDG